MRWLDLADGQPYHGQSVAVVDESARRAGAGIYYVICAVAILEPADTARLALEVVGERKRPFHFAKEGVQAIERMLSFIEATELLATVLWRSVARRDQVAARRDLLTELALRCAHDGIDHLIIESGDWTTNRRDQRVLLDAFSEVGPVPFRYDWRSKREPLLWVADAISGISSEFLLNDRTWLYQRLHTKGQIELSNW